VVAGCVTVALAVLGAGALAGEPAAPAPAASQASDVARARDAAQAPADRSTPASPALAATGGSRVRFRSPEPVRVLRAWDARRAEAWARGSPADLRQLYVGEAGRADRALLRAYRDRGLRVEEMEAQLLAVEVLDRSPRSWTLRVTDRLRRAVAVEGTRRVTLPRDRPSVRQVRLVRVGGAWRVAEVSAPGRRR
jgi:hypothetical protein